MVWPKKKELHSVQSLAFFTFSAGNIVKITYLTCKSIDRKLILKEKLRIIILTLNLIHLTIALNFWRKAYLLNLEGIKKFSNLFSC